MPQYAGDPRWITAKFGSKCECGQSITRGQRIFYYPMGKKALCPACGEKAGAEFVAMAMDEDMAAGRSW